MAFFLDVSVLLETALSEIVLPVPATTLVLDLTLDQMSELATTITDVTGYLIWASDMEYCETGLPKNLVTLIFGKYSEQVVRKNGNNIDTDPLTLLFQLSMRYS